jgi:nitroimidazol reductase NimA-like FMN-containing flavoprotein (pyridoxamine 5'-phosphate oxidase superfamily)
MTENESFEVLSEAECRRLLGEHHVGRVAFVDHDYPVVLPVNYVVDGNAIAIRTDAGAKLDAIPLHRVAFEIDGVEEWNHTGWSVLVQGFGQDVSDAIGARYEELRAHGPETWVPGERSHWLTIDIQRISGRRIQRRPGVTSRVIQ